MDELVHDIFVLLVMLAIPYGIFKFTTYANAKECAKWGGDYHWTSGCLMEIDGQIMPLEDYKQVIKTQYMKPIPTNTNINLTQKD
jgi:hypothetical protein